MKKRISIIALITFVFCFTIFAQQDNSDFEERIKTCFIALKDGDKYVLSGDGYFISIETFDQNQSYYLSNWSPLQYRITYKLLGPNYMPLSQSFTPSLKKTIAVSQTIILRGGATFALTSNKKDGDIIKSINTAYLVPIEKDRYLTFLFSKSNEIDTTFQKQFVEYFYQNPIPTSIVKHLTDTVVTIAGQQIAMTDSFRITDVGKIEDNIRSKLMYTVFSSEDESLKAKEIELSNVRRLYSNRILYDNVDTIVFAGEKIPSNKFCWQVNFYHKWVHNTPPKVKTIYTFTHKMDENKTYLFFFEFFEDTLKHKNGLPPFFEQNFMQLTRDNSREICSKIEHDSISARDTLYVKQRLRLPVWTYYDKNTVIWGISLGFGQGARNVTTNGIKISAPGIGILSPLFPSFPLPTDSDEEFQEAQQYRALYKNAKEVVNGINFGGSGDWLINTYVNGLNINLIGSCYVQNNGITLSGS